MSVARAQAAAFHTASTQRPGAALEGLTTGRSAGPRAYGVVARSVTAGDLIGCCLIGCCLIACVDGAAGGAAPGVPSRQASPTASAEATGRQRAQRQPAVAADGVEGRSAAALVAIPEPPSTAGAVVDAVPVGLVPTPIPPARPRKRLNIDQLDAALRRASGDIGWTAGVGNNVKNEFVTLALTLGKANYTDITTEDLEASALFQKFLADAAASICGKRVNADLASAASERLLLIGVDPKLGYEAQPAAVDKALRRAVLRFHGRVLAADDPELESWRFLFQGATKISGKPAEGWRAVCAALIQHPAFSTY